MTDRTDSKPDADDIDRRGLLRCMAWVGTGLVWTLRGGIPTSQVLGQEPAAGDFSFVQISDSHIGFSKEPNKDVAATLKVALGKCNAMPQAPAFLLHTGDLTHLAKPEEFDTVAEILKTVRGGQVATCPGEHDVFTDDGKLYRERFGKGSLGKGWRSFDYKGVHFIGLVNVADLKPGGLGMLGMEQIDWLKKDVAGLAASTPLVVFAHVPLWTVYEKWGWGTEDAAQALGLLKRFGSVTVLNGHVHQAMQKVEGNITFHTARSTAFPQPEPGKADSPGPVKNIAAENLRKVLGLAAVKYVEKPGSLAVVGGTLE
jgi:3',5'-cyclic AMP phosphodiesterase CpdA